MDLRFNHMELTLPLGTITDGFAADVEAFYGDVFGFISTRGELYDLPTLTLRLPDASFILLMESDRPMSAPGYDHLGFELGSVAEVDDTLAKVEAWQRKDDRIVLKRRPAGALDDRFYPRSYYLRHLLPIWIDVQYSEPVT
jgi:hypothetical protein